MKPQTFAITVLFLILAAVGMIFSGRPPLPAPAAPVPPAPPPPARTFTVVGEGKMRVPPDLAIFRFTLENVGESIQAAQGKNDLAYAALLHRLHSLGIEPDGIITLGRRVQPEGTPEAAGRRVSMDMEVRVHRLDSLPEVRDAVNLANPARVEAVTYDLGDRTKAVREALVKAMADARERANVVAQAAAAKLDRSTQATVLEPGAGPEQPLELDGGELVVRARVQVTFST